LIFELLVTALVGWGFVALQKPQIRAGLKMGQIRNEVAV